MSDNFSPNATTNAAAFVFSADEVGTETSGKPVLVTRVKVQHGPDGSATDVSSASPLPVRDALGATAAGQDAALAVLQQVATAAGQATALTALQQILAKLIATPSTAQGQADQLAALTTLVGQTDGIEGSLASILAKLSADPATAAAQAAELVKLTSMDAKMPALVGGLAPIRLSGSAIALDLVADSAGNLFSPGASAHAYGYDGSGIDLSLVARAASAPPMPACPAVCRRSCSSTPIPRCVTERRICERRTTTSDGIHPWAAPEHALCDV